MGTEKYSNDETQQSESAINKVSPVKKVGSRKILITTLLVLLVIGVVGGVGYYFLRKKGPQVVEPTIEKAKENNTPSIPAKKEAPKKEVFFVENNKLWGVDAEGKKTEIDSGVTSAGGSVLSGSDFPLTSADLTKAAYIKNGTVWVYESDGEKKQKIDQPTVTKFNDKYSFQTIAWSTNGENLLFSLNFECGMMCEDNEVEDASITGTYWYSLKNNKSKKLSIKGEEISMWFPNKEEFVYIKDNKLFSYDVNSDSSEVITVTPFKTNTLQLSFSDDGSKIIYAEAFDSQSRIVIANPDNTGQQVLKTGGWADYQWPRFIGSSKTDYVYSKRAERVCGDGNGGCPRNQMHIVVNGKDSLTADIINHVLGWWDVDKAIVIVGDNYDLGGKKALSIYNFKTNSFNTLYEAASLDLRIGWFI